MGHAIQQIGIESNPYYRPGHWVPHCTIASDLSDSAIQTALDIARRGAVFGRSTDLSWTHKLSPGSGDLSICARRGGVRIAARSAGHEQRITRSARCRRGVTSTGCGTGAGWLQGIGSLTGRSTMDG